MHNIHHSNCTALPPHMMRHLAEHGDAEARQNIQSTIQQTALIAQRRQHTAIPAARAIATPKKRVSVYNARRRRTLPGDLEMNDRKGSRDIQAKEAFKGSGATYDFFAKRFGRNSIDDLGMRLISTIHYGKGFSNAMWDGRQMIYGDGDGRYFNRFTIALDVIAHEHTHGVTQHSAGLEYQGQSGALNEHISDVFGSIIKQQDRGQTAGEADWLIGEGLFTSSVKGTAIRSMKAPGTAYDDPVLGRDPQPAHMRDYVASPDDNGGVHINSGIPNFAFYQAAVTIGGNTWEAMAEIWYRVVTQKLGVRAQFADMARETTAMAAELFGWGATAHIIADAWDIVGIPVSINQTTGLRAGAPREERPSDRPTV